MRAKEGVALVLPSRLFSDPDPVCNENDSSSPEVPLPFQGAHQLALSPLSFSEVSI